MLETEVTLPVAPRGDYSFPRGAVFAWKLSTRDFRSVDEALDLSGYDSPLVFGQKYGSERIGGTFALSAERTFQTAP